MTVHFIGAGPGDPELLTKKAERVIGQCPVCLYAGSLVPPRWWPARLRVRGAGHRADDAGRNPCRDRGGPRGGEDVARVHSGDPSLYGAIAEQIRRLRADGIPYEIVPGVPAYAAAAAALGQELTVPEVAQSVVLTRVR